jgi:hypothetical protein
VELLSLCWYGISKAQGLKQSCFGMNGAFAFILNNNRIRATQSCFNMNASRVSHNRTRFLLLQILKLRLPNLSGDILYIACSPAGDSLAAH